MSQVGENAASNSSVRNEVDEKRYPIRRLLRRKLRFRDMKMMRSRISVGNSSMGAAGCLDLNRLVGGASGLLSSPSLPSRCRFLVSRGGAGGRHGFFGPPLPLTLIGVSFMILRAS